LRTEERRETVKRDVVVKNGRGRKLRGIGSHGKIGYKLIGLESREKKSRALIDSPATDGILK